MGRKLEKEKKKRTGDLNRHFFKEDIIIDNQHMKKCSLLIIKLQNKTIMKYHLTPVKMAIITNSTNNKCLSKGRKGKLLALLVGK